MATSLTRAGIKFVALILIVTAMVSCGRRGALEAPPSAGIETQQSEMPEGAQQLNSDKEAAAAEPVKEDKPFFLDPLL